MKKVLAIILAVAAVLLMSFPAYAADPEPSTAEVDITVISESVDLDVNLTADDANVSINGLSTSGVTINGEEVATERNVSGKASKEAIWELRDDNRNQWEIINRIANELGITQQAVVKMIGDNSELYTRIAALDGDSSALFGNMDVLYADMERMQSKITYLSDEITRLNAEKAKLDETINATDNKMTKLERQINEMQLAEYNREHSGFVYNVKRFFSGIGDFFRTTYAITLPGNGHGIWIQKQS